MMQQHIQESKNSKTDSCVVKDFDITSTTEPKSSSKVLLWYV
jgi:hypothetical protein